MAPSASMKVDLTTNRHHRGIMKALMAPLRYGRILQRVIHIWTCVRIQVLRLTTAISSVCSRHSLIKRHKTCLHPKSHSHSARRSLRQALHSSSSTSLSLSHSSIAAVVDCRRKAVRQRRDRFLRIQINRSTLEINSKCQGGPSRTWDPLKHINRWTNRIKERFNPCSKSSWSSRRKNASSRRNLMKSVREGSRKIMSGCWSLSRRNSKTQSKADSGYSLSLIWSSSSWTWNRKAWTAAASSFFPLSSKN